MLFRFGFLFLVSQVVLFALNVLWVTVTGGLTLHFSAFFDLANYVPSLWLSLGIGIAGTVAWSYLGKGRTDRQALYYLLRALLRFRLAITLFAYGFLKWFPLQMPAPTLSDLNTAYGDFLPWKIYWLTVGAASAGYQSALGLLEIVAGSLLLFRITAPLGALLGLLTLSNALSVNIAYQTGQYAYSLYPLLLAVRVLSEDVPRLFRLAVLEKPARANRYPGMAWTGKQRLLKKGLKITFALAIAAYGYLVYVDYRSGSYLLPQGRGVPQLQGYYEVTEFRLNGQPLPYQPVDANRWQNVVFEPWATMSVKRAMPVQLDRTKYGFGTADDIDRNYESAGTVGRHYFSYSADTVSQKLHLQNKNKQQRTEQWDLHYETAPNGALTLSGLRNQTDSVYIVLEKIDKKYLLKEGRRKPIRLSAFQ